MWSWLTAIENSHAITCFCLDRRDPSHCITISLTVQQNRSCIFSAVHFPCIHLIMHSWPNEWNHISIEYMPLIQWKISFTNSTHDLAKQVCLPGVVNYPKCWTSHSGSGLLPEKLYWSMVSTYCARARSTCLKYEHAICKRKISWDIRQSEGLFHCTGNGEVKIDISSTNNGALHTVHWSRSL